MTELPVVSSPETLDEALVVPGVLLAAGTSSRFGTANKLLAQLHETPVVRLAARHLVDSFTSPDYAIVGYEADRIRTVLADLPITICENPSYDEGQGSSVRAAIDELAQHDADGVLFALGDMPCVKPSSINALIRTFATGNWSALAAASDGTRGNPVLFGAKHFPALANASGDTGAKHILLSAADAALVETHDPGVTRDIDTNADLTELQSD